MKDTCERLKFPFEVLIQGSNGNRLVRSLFADPNADLENDAVCVAKDPQSRPKRNTVSIYKPQIESGSTSDIIVNAENTDDNAQIIEELEQLLSEIDLDDEIQRLGKH